MKAFYIYSYHPDESSELDYDWFVGEHGEDYPAQRKVVLEYMRNEQERDNPESMLVDIYMQDTKILIADLKETK